MGSAGKGHCTEIISSQDWKLKEENAGQPSDTRKKIKLPSAWNSCLQHKLISKYYFFVSAAHTENLAEALQSPSSATVLNPVSY